MAESRSHAPGHEANESGMSLHKQMAGGAGGGSFGCGPVPGSNAIKGRPPASGTLSDSDRSGGPGIHIGTGSMTATRHSDHGDHRHQNIKHGR